MADGMETVLMASSGFSIVVGTLLDVALLVVALTIVKKNRRDSLGWILASAIIALVHGVASHLFSWAATAFVSREYGVESVLVSQTAISIFSTVLSAVSFGLLIVGISRLARPPANA